MSDCVYYAFAEALRYSNQQARTGSYQLFRLLKVALGTPTGVPTVVVPFILGWLANYNNAEIVIGVHPWVHDLGFVSRREYYSDPGVTPRYIQRWIGRHTQYGDRPLSSGPAIYLDVERQHALFCTSSPAFFCEMSFEIRQRRRQ